MSRRGTDAGTDVDVECCRKVAVCLQRGVVDEAACPVWRC